MKRFSWTWIALIAVGLLLSFTLFDGQRVEEKKTREEKDKTLVKFPADAIVKVEISGRNANVVVERAGSGASQGWHLVAPLKARADAEAIQQLLVQLTTEKSVQTIVEGSDLKPTDRLDTYGLNTPLGRVRVTAADGTSHEVRIGTVTAYDSNLYAQVDQDPRVELVTGTWDLILSKSAKDLRDKEVFHERDLKFSDLQRIVVSRPTEGSQQVVELKREGEQWRITGGRKVPLAIGKIEEFFEKVKSLRALQFIDDKNGELLKRARKALSKPELIVELYTSTKAPVFSMKVFPEEGSKFGTFFAEVAGRTDVVTVSGGSVAAMDKSVHDFYDRLLPFQFKPGDVEKVEFATAELTGIYEKNDSEWRAANPEIQKRVDSAKLTALLERLSHMEALRILAPLTAQSYELTSRLTLKNKNDAKIFELAWGSKIEKEKPMGRRPEARFLAASTNLSDHYLGVAEGEVRNLGLAALVAPVPDSTSDPK